jgi:hypothetical protein
MREKLTTLVTGGAGFGGIEFLQANGPAIVEKVGEATSLILQIAIGVATFVGLFKKKKK